ncbi:alpha/beta hydrolase [Paenibacillus glycanilyticus]|uniref:alpha/beta hydrolase n=1 Tax=Paenibacillus glycanilyticus TaxID=126569 RepID=UPI000FD6C013|nr:alpha/beta hydrolase [Paenibacillus glycanilyticus]
MRVYGQEIVNDLQAQQEEANLKGTQVIVKVNPEETRAGYLDPYELQIIRKWAGEQKAATDQPPSPEEQLRLIRDSMGFPNRNLNTVEIYTGYERVKLGDNEVGLWRYYPRKSMRKPNKPCLIYIHGGGWIGGTVFAVENPCRLIAELADAVVFNIDYSLAPEHKFPNGFNDCFNAVQYIYEHAEEYGIDRNRIAVGGDSAGGNLSAAVATKDRDLGTRMVAQQVLIYPCVTFLNGVNGYQWELSQFEMSDEQKAMIDPMLGIGRPTDADPEGRKAWELYLPHEEEVRNPYVSQLLADSAGLPRTLCVGAEFDGLRIQSEVYSRQLAAAGVPVKTIRYKGCTHAFIDRLGFVPQAEDLCIEIANALKAL